MYDYQDVYCKLNSLNQRLLSLQQALCCFKTNICSEVDTCLGISPSGSVILFLNEQGEFVDSGSNITANNGLTKTVDNIQLGGDIIQPTELAWAPNAINNYGFQFTNDFASLGVNAVNFEYGNTAGTIFAYSGIADLTPFGATGVGVVSYYTDATINTETFVNVDGISWDAINATNIGNHSNININPVYLHLRHSVGPLASDARNRIDFEDGRIWFTHQHGVGVPTDHVSMQLDFNGLTVKGWDNLAATPALLITNDAGTTSLEVFNDGRVVQGAGQRGKVRVVTAAGAITVLTTDYIVLINKTIAATSAVSLYATPTVGDIIIIKDGKGDANSNNIIITPAAGTIDGGATLTLNVNYQSITLVYGGVEWSII